jgi:hypothetical protein
MSRDELAITGFLSECPDTARTSYLVSTSGVVAVVTDLALATTRANNACDIAKKLYQNAEVSIRTSTGKSIGQFCGGVSVYIVGTKNSLVVFKSERDSYVGGSPLAQHSF